MCRGSAFCSSPKSIDEVMTKSSLFTIKNTNLCRETILNILDPPNEAARIKEVRTKKEGDADFIAIARRVPLEGYFCVKSLYEREPYQGKLPSAISNGETFINHYRIPRNHVWFDNKLKSEEKNGNGFKVRKCDQEEKDELTKSWPDGSNSVFMYQVVTNSYYDN